jgi:hypothetical protein
MRWSGRSNNDCLKARRFDHLLERRNDPNTLWGQVLSGPNQIRLSWRAYTQQRSFWYVLQDVDSVLAPHTPNTDDTNFELPHDVLLFIYSWN